jgi:hypothetical protein
MARGDIATNKWMNRKYMFKKENGKKKQKKKKKIK